MCLADGTQHKPMVLFKLKQGKKKNQRFPSGVHVKSPPTRMNRQNINTRLHE